MNKLEFYLDINLYFQMDVVVAKLKICDKLNLWELRLKITDKHGFT